VGVSACLAAGVADAEAYLHERLGNYEAALRLHLARAAAANAALEAALLGGQVALVELPAWATGLAWRTPPSPGRSPRPGAPGAHSSTTAGSHGPGSDTAAAAAATALHVLEQLPYGLGALSDTLRRIVARQAGAGAEPGAHDHSASHGDADCSQQEQWHLVVKTVATWLHQQLAPAATSSRKQPGHGRRGATHAGSRSEGQQQQQQQQAGGRLPGVSSYPKGAPLPSPRHRQVMPFSSFARVEASTPTSPSPAASAASFLIVQLMAGVRLSHQGWLVALSPRTQLGSQSNSSGSSHGQGAAPGSAAAVDGAAGGALELAPPPAGEDSAGCAEHFGTRCCWVCLVAACASMWPPGASV
jgi:hypothetical protein